MTRSNPGEIHVESQALTIAGVSPSGIARSSLKPLDLAAEALAGVVVSPSGIARASLKLDAIGFEPITVGVYPRAEMLGPH